MWRNDTKCKYMFMFPLKNLARKGLRSLLGACRQTVNHDLNQCWPKSVTPYDVTRPHWVDSSPPAQNGRHFADGIFRYIFVNENFCILIRISLKFVFKGPFVNNQQSVWIMTWYRPGNKPLSESMVIFYWRIYTSLGLNELRKMFCRDDIIQGWCCNDFAIY